MRPEDVPAEWVEKAADAMSDAYDQITQDEISSMHQIEARAALAAVLPLIVAKAFQDAADETERYGTDTYWRDDSPFHAQGRFHASEHAKRLRADAAGWLITTTEGKPT